jgi:hypothetical protein
LSVKCATPPASRRRSWSSSDICSAGWGAMAIFSSIVYRQYIAWWKTPPVDQNNVYHYPGTTK